MGGSLLYLVEQHNKPVKPEIRIAVEAAFRWSVREYRNMDEADIAATAEAAALGMSKRLAEIQSPWRYALAVLLQDRVHLRRPLPAGSTLVTAVEEQQIDRLKRLRCNEITVSG